MCYHRRVRACLLTLLLLAGADRAWSADLLAEARRLYNLGQYATAEKVAREAVAVPATADAAKVVLGRIQLERYRQSNDAEDLTAARASLRDVDARALEARERVELIIGLAEALYLEDRFAAAGELFESVFDRSSILGLSAHERVLDWWATAIDRHAQTLTPPERPDMYRRIIGRMRDEIVSSPGSTAAAYWLAAAARASGHPDEAWHYAVSGWVRAPLAEDRGATLRADLDRLVMQAIIPERAAKLGSRGDPKVAQANMVTEWEAFKAAWSR
jgi:tetratricopeptide (TPR) repeat protein